MTSFAIMVAVVTGLVSAIKRAGLSSRYAPLLSVILGLGLAFFFVGHDSNSLFQGLIVALSASGLYSGVKTSANL